MSIPSPCYLLAQTETVSSQTISLHWTITRFPISRLVNKGPNSLSGFQAHEKMVQAPLLAL